MRLKDADKQIDSFYKFFKSIVRCKDCKYWVYEDIWGSGRKRHLCSESTTDEYEWAERDADDFCSRGEKKDE